MILALLAVAATAWADCRAPGARDPWPALSSLEEMRAITSRVDRPETLRLDDAFAPKPDGDRDHDCMSDEAENTLADAFKPQLLFDTRENARTPTEPMTLYQVTASPRIAPPNCGKRPRKLILVYGMLFRNDGGYVLSSICGNAHHGDNEKLRMEVDVSEDGKTFSLARVQADGFDWPKGHPMRFFGLRTPVVYLSAGKHHKFFEPVDRVASPESKYGGICHDGANGAGAEVMPTILWDQPFSHNVGEPQAHPGPFFAGDLSMFGFPGENAWSERKFCGAYKEECSDEMSPLSTMWE